MLPGLGVGGYCLTKDPAFAEYSAKHIYGTNLKFPFSELALKNNKQMPNDAFNKIKLIFKNNLVRKKILICGITYKEVVGDTRESPSQKLYTMFSNKGCIITCTDPNINYWEELNLKINTKLNLNQFYKYDIVIFAVKHQDYSKIDFNNIKEFKGYIFDVNNVLSKNQINNLLKQKINIYQLGR